MGVGELNLWLTLSAGILSFISPCVFPLYPSYISYVTGLSVNKLSHRSELSIKDKRQIIVHTLFFVFGLSSIFFLLGSTFTFLGDVFRDYQDLIRMIGATFIVVMGFFASSLIKMK